MSNILYDVEFVPSSHINVGIKTTDFGPAVDCRDCNGVLFILSGDSEGLDKGTSGTLRAQCSTDSAAGGTWASYGSSVAVYSTRVAGIKGMRVLDVFNPRKPYLRAAWSGTTGDVSLVSMKYGMRKPGSTASRDTATVVSALVNTS
jgi:hypothetical protein